MTLTIEDLKRFQHQYPDYRLELVDGAIIFMSPSGFEAAEIAAAIIVQLWAWVNPRRLGRVAASSAGLFCPTLPQTPVPRMHRLLEPVECDAPPKTLLTSFPT